MGPIHQEAHARTLCRVILDNKHARRSCRRLEPLQEFNQLIPINRFRQVIIGPGFERHFQVGVISFRRHQQDEHFVAAVASPQFATQINTTFPRQDPVEDKERESFGRQSTLSILRRSDLCHFVATHSD